MEVLGKYSFGIGDRFSYQGNYLLRPFIRALSEDCKITPVWNKSFREHCAVKSEPNSVLNAAKKAVKEEGWQGGVIVDADHITMENVTLFLSSSNFFTIDVANKIGQRPPTGVGEEIFKLVSKMGTVFIDGLGAFSASEEDVAEVVRKYFVAVEEVDMIHKIITGHFQNEVIFFEVSIDEVEEPQSPLELYFILLMLSQKEIQIDTIAPRFSGKFCKGIDYIGDVKIFEQEFEAFQCVIEHFRNRGSSMKNLKLSMHTGSDKFTLYPIIHRLLKKYDVGLHVKTAGTTWLEELIGLAQSGGTSLDMAKTIYKSAFQRYYELISPYDSVLEIDWENLPNPTKVESWNSKTFVDTLKHDATNPHYNRDFRQLMHTAYKIAAEMGNDFFRELKKNKIVIGRNVEKNVYENHIRPLFIGK